MHDEIKTNWAKNNNKKLLRINFKDRDKIEKILHDYLINENNK